MVSKSTNASVVHVPHEHSKVERVQQQKKKKDINRFIARSIQLHQRSLGSVSRTNMQDTTLECKIKTLHDVTKPKIQSHPETNSLHYALVGFYRWRGVVLAFYMNQDNLPVILSYKSKMDQ